jgi:hypothetical protein
MDSLKFINVGSQDTTISYLAKEVVEDSITDNLGQLSYRVVRYLSDTTGSSEWTPSIAYMVTPLRNSVEVVETICVSLNGHTCSGLVTWSECLPGYQVRHFIYSLYGWMELYHANTGRPFDVLAGTIPVTVT